MNIFEYLEKSCRIQGNTGYWARSLYVRPAKRFSCIRYSKLEISRFFHLVVIPLRLRASANLVVIDDDDDDDDYKDDDGYDHEYDDGTCVAVGVGG
jgi:hypothetical protein